MAEIKANAGTLSRTANTLRQAATQLDLQRDTLNEVAQIVEAAWTSQSTATFSECIRRTARNVKQAGNNVRSSARTLEGAAYKIQVLETLDVADIF